MQKNYYPSTYGCYFTIWGMVLNHCAKMSNYSKKFTENTSFGTTELCKYYGVNFKGKQYWGESQTQHSHTQFGGSFFMEFSVQTKPPPN